MTYSIKFLTLLGAFIPVLVSVVTYIAYVSFSENSQNRLICQEDLGSGKVQCRPYCKDGHFSLPGMDQCQPLLNCNDIDAISREEIIGHGAVKMVQRGHWRGHEVAINTLYNIDFKEDFMHGLKMILSLQPSDHVVQLIGACDKTYVTQYYPLGAANNLEFILQSKPYQKHDTIQTRLQICVSYVKAIHFLHTSPMGTRVMCDSNDPNKSLSQFLVRRNLDLVLNDLDALPEVHSELGSTIKCGHKDLVGDFVAPEQLWPFDDVEFEDTLMPGYDEKTDIWKIPDVCDVILGPGSVSLRLLLLEIHSRCKEDDPSLRPSASEVLNVYTEVLHVRNKN